MNDAIYIWINPVTADLYDPASLDHLLKQHSCIPVTCREDWGGAVREKYRQLAEQTRGIVADARCPMAADLVRSLPDHPLRPAPIEPILLHAARELAGREDLRDLPKWITTPCRALADLGNGLDLPDTRFFAWKDLLAQWGENPPVGTLADSPIPLGFFDSTGLPVRKLSGEADIRRYLEAQDFGGERLTELLYCRGGCHNGDGVTFHEAGD